jgi:hypothetical protein
MTQQHSDPAAALAFQSDVARALARRPADMPLHAQTKEGTRDEASSAEKNPKEKQQ